LSRTLKELKEDILRIAASPAEFHDTQSAWGRRDGFAGIPPAHFDSPYYNEYRKTLKKKFRLEAALSS
jgi:hypothetical protein